MPHFNGFCLSQEYGNTAKFGDPIQTSITAALQVAGFEEFFKKCEHSNFPNVNDLLIKTLNIEEAKKFFEEMKPQKEALETYSNYFDYCKTKDENNLAVSNKLKWFEYMINKYPQPMLQVTSNHPAEQTVKCILDNYKGTAFYADGFVTDDLGITIQLIAPETVTLATVKNYQGGSTTQYLNIRNSSNKVIPQSDIFDNAVNKCQSAQ